MKKIINDPNKFIDEYLEGLLLAHQDSLKNVARENRALVRADAPVQGKVGIVTGGGSGHLPVFLGYVGKGLGWRLEMFSSPPADCEATKAVSTGKGVLYLYGNYAGDRLNFETAEEMAEADGIEVEQVLVSDDVASVPKPNRRGIAGLFFAYKIAAALRMR